MCHDAYGDNSTFIGELAINLSNCPRVLVVVLRTVLATDAGTGQYLNT